jgi:DNA-binding NarL/FixJ family response regulator
MPIDIQLVGGSRPGSPPPRANASDGARPDGADGKRVLIVEDETILAMDIQGMLRAAGFEVAGVASDAAQACRLAEATRPALAIMDIRLARGSDGIEAAATILRDFGIKSVLLSAHLDADTRRRAEAAHPYALLDKPVKPDRLIEVVGEALNES